jgi:ADP-ribose pyrophosphatase YjhB (NUDIX family)
VRPLGGSVEFGESAKDAVIREFKEEIDVEVSILAGPMVLENVFVHEGQKRHEILFIFDLEFPLELSKPRNASASKRMTAPQWSQLGMICENWTWTEALSFTQRASRRVCLLDDQFWR